mmetsp:Transcript_28199/g.65066  ORF Transcript_28199/g.65066 Transcript_28199/m.65066 type:complete len:222 (-) Transcript_28199:1884-2549(-)
MGVPWGVHNRPGSHKSAHPGHPRIPAGAMGPLFEQGPTSLTCQSCTSHTVLRRGPGAIRVPAVGQPSQDYVLMGRLSHFAGFFASPAPKGLWNVVPGSLEHQVRPEQGGAADLGSQNVHSGSLLTGSRGSTPAACRPSLFSSPKPASLQCWGGAGLLPRVLPLVFPLSCQPGPHTGPLAGCHPAFLDAAAPPGVRLPRAGRLPPHVPPALAAIPRLAPAVR